MPVKSLQSRPRRPRSFGPWTLVAVSVASVIAGWLFLVKLNAFDELGTTSDLYIHYQLATSWLRGRFYQDNCFGQILNAHTYLVVPLLAIFALPFGVPGLLLADAIAVGISLLAAVGILRHYSVPDSVAIPAAALLVASPFSAHLHYDKTYAFHVELLVPSLSLCLLYCLLRRLRAASIATAIAMIGIKEEVPLLVGVIGAMVVSEQLLRRRESPEISWGDRLRESVRSPAFMVIIVALVALPMLLLILRSAPPSPHSWGTFGRLHATRGQNIESGLSLAAFAMRNLPAWIAWAFAREYFNVMFWGTAGLIVLRPQFVPLGFLLTLTGWLMGDDLLWPARFSMLMGFLLCVSVLVLGSSYRFLARFGAFEWRAIRYGAILAGLGLAAIAFQMQYRAVPDAGEVYRMAPIVVYSPEERRQAARVAAIYRQQTGPDDPVIASPFLFRHAVPENLYWFNRLQGRPRPVWILSDGEFDFAATELSLGDYTVVAGEGRFRLYKRKEGSGSGRQDPIGRLP